MSEAYIIKKCEKMVTFKAETALFDFLNDYAKLNRCSRSEAIKSIIRGYMAKEAEKA